MRKAHTRALALVAGVAALGLLAGCSAPSSPSASATSKKPAVIDVWGWDAEMTPNIVKAFNASHTDVQVNYVLQASNPATVTNFRNVMKSKKGIPCWVPATGPVTTAVVNGWAQDITKYIKPIESKFSAGALAGAKLDGKYYGFPSGPDATFALVNEKVYSDNGIAVPKTWDDLIAAGKQLKPKGITVINLAGEDPSTLIQIEQLAGAKWFTIDGDRWKVNFTDANSLKGADVIQQIVDNDLASHQTYQDRPSLYAYFDSGKLATVPLAWWSLFGYQTNLKASLGTWKAVDFPQLSDSGPFKTPGIANPGIVPVGCKDPAAAVEYQTWVATSAAGIAASKSTKTDAISLPTSLKDVSKYTAAIVPDKLIDPAQSKAQVGAVIAKAQSAAIGSFNEGPDYDAWFPELQDQWGKAMAKQITVKQALENVQAFVVQDLKTKGINYTVAK